MLKRKIYAELLEWKNISPHKALVIKGQRQVGKTFIVREFAKNEYEHVIEINFSQDQEVKVAFEGNLRVEDIIRKLMAFYDPSEFVPGRTLLFFDEIQDYPPAWSSLKAFTENGTYDVIASGSRIRIDTDAQSPDSEISPLLPTGYQTFLTMKPLDFEEFLWGNGIPQSIIDEVINALYSREQIDNAFNKRFEDLFKEYMIVGGMPEAVDAYVSTKDYSKTSGALNDLWEMSHHDINRYNRGSDKIKTAECFESIPDQLSQTNKKFMYSRIEGDKSRKSAEKYMGNLLWIKYSGLGLFCNALLQPTKPLKSNKDKSTFKVYLSDTGLLLNRYGQPALKAIIKDDLSYNYGALVENLVAVCLDHCGYELFFYRKNNGPAKMELDFVIETEEGLTVVEVKSGRDRDAPSIKKACRIHQFDRKVILERSNYWIDDEGIEHFPLYAAAFFDRLWNEDRKHTNVQNRVD